MIVFLSTEGAVGLQTSKGHGTDVVVLSCPVPFFSSDQLVQFLASEEPKCLLLYCGCRQSNCVDGELDEVTGEQFQGE